MRRRTTTAFAAVLALAVVATTAPTTGAWARTRPLEPVPAPAAISQVVVGDFESGAETWDLHTSGTATGELALVAEQPVSGTQVGRLHASVPTGTLEAARWPGPIEATAIEMSVRSTDVDVLTVRIQDATGQAHQQRVTLDPDAEGWQQVRIEEFTAGEGYLHFGGADDGVWHGPLRAISVILDTWSFRDGATSGVLDLDAVLADVETATPPLTLSTLVDGNVFHTGEDVAIGIDGEADDVAWTVRDGYGSVIEQGSASADSLAGTLPLDLDQPGYYAVDVVGTTADGARHLVGTDVAVLNPLAEDFVRDPRLAVATHYGQSWPLETAALVADAGFGLGRDEAYWGGQETTPGEIVWQDKIVAYQDEFADLGLGHFRVLSYGNTLYFPDEAPSTPEGREAFARYALATVAELGTEGNYFEVWNEWNWRDLDGAAAGSAAQYVALLEVVSSTVKAEYPDAVLVGPAMAPMNDWQGWFTEFADLGGLDLVDAVSTHPYTFPDAPEGSGRFGGHWGALREIMTAHGHGDMPIMLSETGWPTSATAVGVDEPTQAERQTRGVLVALADGIDNVTIYDFMDDGTDDAEVEHRFGMIRNTDDERGAFVPKPAYVGSAVLNRQIAGLELDRNVDLGEDAWDAVFSDGDRTVHAAWATAPSTAAFAVTGPVTVTGMFGEVTELTPGPDGLVHVSLGEQPVYVEGAITGVSLSEHYQLEVDDEVAGTPTAGRVRVTNGGAAALDVEATPLDGSTVSASVPPGTTSTIDVSFDAQESGSARTYSVLVGSDGATHTLLRATGAPTPALTLTGTHGVGDDGQTLRLRVTNNAAAAATLDGVDVTVAGQTVRLGEAEPLAARGSLTLTLPVAVEESTAWSATASAGGAPASAAGRLLPLSEPVGAPALAVDLDGSIDEEVAEMPAHLIGTDEAPTVQGWTGPDDVSAQIWLTHDDDRLYVTAQVRDDVHAQPASGADLWQGDGLQIGLVAGAPGEDPVAQELGVALTNVGDVTVHRWAPSSLAGEPEGVDAVITRDEDASTTTYEVAIDWSAVGIDPAGRLLAGTVVVNENDGEGRDGWLSWGLGLAETKSTALFNTVVLEPEAPVGPDPITLRTSVRSQCWGEQAVVAVHVVNTSDHRLDIRLTTAWGERKLTSVQPDAAVYHGFVTGSSEVAAGSATIAAYAWNDGDPVYLRTAVPFDAVACG